MFLLTEFRDTVAIEPQHFKLKLNDAIVFALNKKFSNKVVHNVGLCIALWDITKIDDSFIFPGDGASHTIVEFRFVVFRPFLDEILIGKIKSCSKEGVYVTIGFFEDILIPAEQLRNPSRFDEKNQMWFWDYEVEGEKHAMSMDIGEAIRWKVSEEVFTDILPIEPGKENNEAVETSSTEKKPPYAILGSIHSDGLGLLTWWLTED